MFFVVLYFLLLNTVEGGVTDNRIVGGRLAKEGEFPFQVSLRRSYNHQHFCGGSLVTSKYVLTAAHCMFYRWGGVLPPATVIVVTGQLVLNITENSILRSASKIVIHENYDKKTMANDVALIELDNELPVDNGHLIKTVALRAKRTASGSYCYVSGWGVQDYNSSEVSNDLLAAEVYTVKFARCQDMYDVLNISLSDGMLCAGTEEGDKDACQGDSGGPLFCNGLLTGVVSTGQGCADPEFPGIYADVVHYLPWIQLNSGITPTNDTDSTISDTIASQAATTEETITDDNLTARNFGQKLKGNGAVLMFFWSYVFYIHSVLWL